MRRPRRKEVDRGRHDFRIQLVEGREIVEYLRATYARGKKPKSS